MQLTCLYHPINKMKVVDDENEYNELIASGLWFDHPTKAKEVREHYEKAHVKKLRLHNAPRKRSSNIKPTSEHGTAST